MKKFIALALSLAIVGGASPTVTHYAPDTAITASAAEYTEGTYGDITYLQYEDHIEILKCDYGVSGAVGVPSKINDLPVTVIRSGAFLACQYITSIQIPSSVTTIGSSAFSQCTFLESAVMSDSVTSIGESAFFGCGKLTSVTLSSNLNAIPTSCFESCESLESITIPESVTSIGNLAFYGCYALTSVTIKNPNCSIYDSKGTFSDTAKEYFDEAAFHGTIYGYEGSTAQAYAEKYGYTFVALNGEPPVTTTTTYVPPERNTATDEKPLVTTTTYVPPERNTATDERPLVTTTTYVPPVTTTTSNETPPVTTTNSATPGDINGDDEVTVADATYIMQWAAAPDEYPLSDTAKKNGDVTGGGDGITTSDALAIQQYLSGGLSSLTVGS